MLTHAAALDRIYISGRHYIERDSALRSYRGRIADELARDHVEVATPERVFFKTPDGRMEDSWNLAHKRTMRLHGELQRAQLARAFDDEEIRAYAENSARLCGQLPMLTMREEFARSCGVEPPPAKTLGERYEGRAARLADCRWWRRQLRKTWTRGAENAMRDLGIIRKGKEPYASDDAVGLRWGQKRKAREFMESHCLTNEAGEQLEMWDVHERSLANPALRRGEFMTRVKGFERIADDLGHYALFFTLTAPSAFHPQLAKGGRNPRFERQHVREAQAWLCKMWARARAKLKRLSVLVYGFRIAEPHHDGTPHWHMLLFVPRQHIKTLWRVISWHWLAEYGDEPGAKRYRVKLLGINRKKGSAVGYVAKYVSKNIDGAGAIGEAQDDETGTGIAEGIARVDAWASLHGIRQFQQIGGAPVGLWRECRRLREAVADADIERARAAADRGDWQAFSQAVCGYGYALQRRDCSLKLHKEETGERNRYGECRPARVVGLRYASALELTRLHRWKVERKGCKRPDKQAKPWKPRTAESWTLTPDFSSGPRSGPSYLGPVAITVRADIGAGEPSQWSNPNETSTAGPH